MNLMDSLFDFPRYAGDNFFQFACGTWNKRNVIPEDKSSFSTFEVS